MTTPVHTKTNRTFLGFQKQQHCIMKCKNNTDLTLENKSLFSSHRNSQKNTQKLMDVTSLQTTQGTPRYLHCRSWQRQWSDFALYSPASRYAPVLLSAKSSVPRFAIAVVSFWEILHRRFFGVHWVRPDESISHLWKRKNPST